MDVVYERCCGLDVHKRTRRGLPGASRGRRAAPEGGADLRHDDRRPAALAAWLAEAAVDAVAMESTGVYWKPIWNLLEDGPFELVLANAQHIKPVPGRKTDVKDAEWIAELLRHGLIRASFVPDRAQRELRELTRYRTALIRERAAEVNRLQKVLEGANIKLPSVASNVVGVSGRAILEQLVAGETDAAALAELARGRLRREAPPAGAGPGRPRRPPPALPGRPAAGPPRRPRRAHRPGQRRDRGAAAALRGGAPAAGHHPGRGAPGGGGARGRGRHRRAPLPHRRAPGLLGGRVPRPPRERGQAPQRAHPQGQPLAARHPDPARLRRRPDEAHLPGGAVPPPGRPPRPEAGRHRPRAQRAGRRLAPPARPAAGYHDLGPGHVDERNRQAVQRRLVRRLEGLGYRVSLEPPTPAA